MSLSVANLRAALNSDERVTHDRYWREPEPLSQWDRSSHFYKLLVLGGYVFFILFVLRSIIEGG